MRSGFGLVRAAALSLTLLRLRAHHKEGRAKNRCRRRDKLGDDTPQEEVRLCGIALRRRSMSVYHNVWRRPAPSPLFALARGRAQTTSRTGGSSPMSQTQMTSQTPIPQIKSRLAAILRATSGNFLEQF